MNLERPFFVLYFESVLIFLPVLSLSVLFEF
jgi:hypothetical protein